MNLLVANKSVSTGEVFKAEHSNGMRHKCSMDLCLIKQTHTYIRGAKAQVRKFAPGMQLFVEWA